MWIARIIRNAIMTILMRIMRNLEKFIGRYTKSLPATPMGSFHFPELDVLHECDRFIVVNKLPDLIINDTDPYRVTVARQLEAKFPNYMDPNLVFGFHFAHRLDYSTSGVLCIAKNKNTATLAANAFQQRDAKKFYLAVLRGTLSVDSMKITTPVGKDVEHKHRMATPSMENCAEIIKSAESRLQVLERGTCYDYPATKVLMRPITGRRHQLRLHCSSIGHTIVGDFTYSNRRDDKPHRMYLHAYKLEIDKLNLRVTAPDPFLPNDPKIFWTPHEVVMSIEDAMTELSKEDSNSDSNLKQRKGMSNKKYNSLMEGRA